MPVNNLIQLRKGDTSAWDTDPVLASGEPGFDIEKNILKIGDGSTAWSSLEPVNTALTNFNIYGTGNINISGNITANTGNFDVVSFNSNNESILTKGQISWDDTEGTMGIGLTDNTTIHIGSHRYFRIRNETGDTLYKGQVVYASGVHANGIIEPALYVADGAVREVRFMGVILEDVNHQNNGYAIDFGHLEEMDLDGSAANYAVGDETWVAGDILYVHPTGAGKLTKNEPKHSISVAIVLDPGNGNGNGRMFVRPASYGHLDDNHDVAVSGATNGQFLQYNSATDYWVPSSSGNFTTLQVNGTSVPTGVGTSNYVTKWTGANSLGSGIIYDDGTNVGIGTSSPSYKLDVSGNIQAYGSYAKIRTLDGSVINRLQSSSFDSVGYIGTESNHDLIIKTNNLDRAIVDKSGNVGIGTTTPSAKLNVESGNVIFNDLGGNYDFRVEGDTDPNLLFTDASTDRVGIGTNTPSYKLDVRYKAESDGGLAILRDGSPNNKGILIGEQAYTASSDYQGITHPLLTGSQDYMMISRGDSTYVSSKDGSITYIRGGGNSITYQLAISSSFATLGGNRLRLFGTETVLNEDGGNVDFRAEGDSDEYLFFADASTDRVGIGTPSPNGKLDVIGGRTFLAANNEPYSLGVRYIDTGGAVYFGAASSSVTPDAVISNAGGSELIRFATSGNVGIGTSSPAYKLDVVGTGHFDALNINGAFTFPTSDGSANQYLKTDGAGNVSWASVAGGGSTIDGSGVSNYITKWTDSDTLTSGIIYDNGTNVGIGTASPSVKLDVNGNAKITASSGVPLTITNTGTANSFVVEDAAGDTSPFVINADGNIIAGGNSRNIGVSSRLAVSAENANWGVAFQAVCDSAGRGVNIVSADYARNPDAGSMLYFNAASGGFTIGCSSPGDSALGSLNLLVSNLEINGAVGIGTASPSYKLDVVGTGNFSQNLLVNGTGVSLNGHIHTISIGTGDVSQLSFNTDQVLNIVGSGGVNISFNDTTNTLTISPPTAVTGYEELTSSKDTFSVSPNYRIGTLSVYYNGFRLIGGRDFTATNGTSFVLAEAGSVGDVVEWVGTT